jgi:hypothetical protein
VGAVLLCGTRKCYQGTRRIKGCRCVECTDANAAYLAAWRDKRPEYYQEYRAGRKVDAVRAAELEEFDDTYGGLLK